ncbi:hypothetical protein ACFQX7_26910 [Luedemannella flava]
MRRAAAPTRAPAPPPHGSLAGICPATIPIQIDWYATPERAAAFQLAGRTAPSTPRRGTYTGAGATGVSIEVRLGGLFIGSRRSRSRCTRTSPSTSATSRPTTVGAAAKFPTRAVVALLDINPQVLMWIPRRHVNAWIDAAATRRR